MPPLVSALEIIGPRTMISSWLGLIAGDGGVIYGLKAKSFTAHGHFTTREPQSFAPTWGHRVFVVTISAVAAITSLLFLLRN